MAVHSFKAQKPNLNKLKSVGWKELYEGYSFIYQTGANHGSGTELETHGSCLRLFSPVSIVQTSGLAIKWLSNSPKALWILDYKHLQYKDLDDGPTVKYVDEGGDGRRMYRERYLGRCVVLAKTTENRKVIYESPADDELSEGEGSGYGYMSASGGSGHGGSSSMEYSSGGASSSYSESSSYESSGSYGDAEYDSGYAKYEYWSNDNIINYSADENNPDMESDVTYEEVPMDAEDAMGH